MTLSSLSFGRVVSATVGLLSLSLAFRMFTKFLLYNTQAATVDVPHTAPPMAFCVNEQYAPKIFCTCCSEREKCRFLHEVIEKNPPKL